MNEDEQPLTMERIAELSGVSIATVSRVISYPEKVREKTRLKVQQIIHDKGYIPNAMASSLSSRGGRTVIGVVVEEIANPFFLELISGLENIVQAKGYSLTFFSTDWSMGKEMEAVKTLIKWRVQGVLLATLSTSSRSIQLLKNNDIPFVLMNSYGTEHEMSVTADNKGGGKLVADLFLRKLRPQNIIVTGVEDLSLKARLDGFKERVAGKFEYHIEKNISTYEQGYNSVSTLVAKYHLKKISTSIWVTNDNVAIAIILSLREHGIAIPEQVGIVGFDNIRASSWCYPALTTIEQSTLEMGKLSINLLLEEINNEEFSVRQYLYPTRLIERDSF